LYESSQNYGDYCCCEKCPPKKSTPPPEARPKKKKHLGFQKLEDMMMDSVPNSIYKILSPIGTTQFCPCYNGFKTQYSDCCLFLSLFGKIKFS
jgi:hypothetical protein